MSSSNLSPSIDVLSTAAILPNVYLSRGRQPNETFQHDSFIHSQLAEGDTHDQHGVAKKMKKKKEDALKRAAKAAAKEEEKVSKRAAKLAAKEKENARKQAEKAQVKAAEKYNQKRKQDSKNQKT